MARRILVLGCGYVGLPLARRWQASGDEVTGWVRSPESASALQAAGLAAIVGNLNDSALWARPLLPWDLIIHAAATGGGGEAAYREVFLNGVERMLAEAPGARLLMISSTSVYGQTQGEWVDETAPAEPASATSQILRQAETALLAAGGTVVRSSGIYGPGRGLLFAKLQRGEAILEGDGTRWINQIHRDDLVSALILLAVSSTPGGIYNATDDTPVTYRDFYAWGSARLGCPFPPSGPVDLKRKRGGTNKRVSNAKLRALGWRPLYPSFREGLVARVE